MATPRRDARKLNHKTLEAIRIRAVEQVQAGEIPEVVIKALGFSRACIYALRMRAESLFFRSFVRSALVF